MLTNVKSEWNMGINVYAMPFHEQKFYDEVQIKDLGAVCDATAL